MTAFSVNPEILTTTASSIRSKAVDINDRIGDVRREVGQTEGTWTGQARGRYVDLMARWERMANEVKAELDRTVALLNNAATDYGTTESTNTRNLSS